jgi:hypothetical protein
MSKVDFDKVLAALESIAGMSDAVQKAFQHQLTRDGKSNPLFTQAIDGFNDGYNLGCKNSRDFLMQEYQRGKLD